MEEGTDEKLPLLKRINRRVVLPLKNLLRLIFLFPYYAVRGSRPVRHFLDREGRALFRKHPPSLNSVQARIVTDLNRDGVALAHLDELFFGENFLPHLRAYADALLAKARAGRKKAFLLYGWSEGRQPVELGENPFLDLSLDPRVLAIVNSYLGTWGKLKFFSMNKTLPVGEGAAPQGSQKWHRDPGFDRICKLFLYLNDVDETAGPFTYIRGSHTGGKFGALFPRRLFGRYGAYPDAKELGRAVPAGARLVGTGKTGALIFCDTLGLHRGGLATKKERYMFTALFEPRSALGDGTLELPDTATRPSRTLAQEAAFALTPQDAAPRPRQAGASP